MFLTDYHIHSTCSDDGYYTMLEMARASREKGVTMLCFTDHCDLDNYLTGEANPDSFSIRDRMREMFVQALADKPDDMALFLGLELGEGNHDPEQAKVIAASPELDFILGSVHNLRDKPDFYNIKYHDEAFALGLIDSYMDELNELSKIDCFDVMAHIGYPIRYTRRAGFKTEISTRTYGEKLTELLKSLIDRGKGIEINCSGFRNEMIGGPIPTVDVLRLYKELGGEIITVGSDAHKTEHAGSGLAQGFDILRELGYNYVTVFEKRKPKFIKI